MMVEDAAKNIPMVKKFLFVFVLLSATTIFAQNINHNEWTMLLETHVDSKGNVNYKEFKNSIDKLDVYLTKLSNNSPTNNASKNEKLAYWINVYNAFTVKLIVDNYPVKSIKDIKQPWDQKFFKIGNVAMSLNHVEHEIIRKMNEPRIHFAIVCASYSCPKLQKYAFTADNLESQLTSVTKEFLADETRNKISEKTIQISKIFDWFAKDFKQDGSLIEFLNKYTDVTISPKAKKRYLEYNWALNE
jgi:hypothetical protein